MTYFQQSLKKIDGLFPVMSLMIVQTRSAPVENTLKKTCILPNCKKYAQPFLQQELSEWVN